MPGHGLPAGGCLDAVTRHRSLHYDLSQEDLDAIGTCRDPDRASEAGAVEKVADNLTLCPLGVTEEKHTDQLASTLSGEPIDLLLVYDGGELPW